VVRMPSGESLGVSCSWRGGRRWSAVSQDGEFTRVSTKSFWPITRFGLGGSIPAIRQGRQRRSERSRRWQTGGQEAETNRLRPLSTKPLPYGGNQTSCPGIWPSGGCPRGRSGADIPYRGCRAACSWRGARGGLATLRTKELR